MTGCIFFNRSYTKWHHALVLDLKKRYGINRWCGYVYGAKPLNFIKNQKEVDYHPLLIDDYLAVEAENEIIDEEFLKRKEEEYGNPFFWQFFTADRNMSLGWPRKFYMDYNPIFNHDQIKKQIQYRIKKIEKMLDEARPDFLLASGVGAMGNMLLCTIAKKRGVKFIIFDPIRVENKLGFSDSIFGTFTDIEEKFIRIRQGKDKTYKIKEAQEWLDKYRDRPSRPAWSVSPQEQLTALNPVLFAKNLVRKVIDSFDDFPQVFGYSVFEYLKRNYLMQVNRYRFPKYDEVNFREDYAFFPLHYEPEMALLVYAPYYTNQLELIRKIAQSLPLHFKFYIKEHPAMLTMRDPNFYKELKKIPNVKLIDPRIDSLDIIKNSKLITVITSTVGWEGALFRKPIITFGSVFYNVLSMVNRCGAIEELPYLINRLLREYEPNDKELIDLISVMLEESVDINIFDPALYKDPVEKIKERADLKSLSDSIIRAVNKNEIN